MKSVNVMSIYETRNLKQYIKCVDNVILYLSLAHCHHVMLLSSTTRNRVLQPIDNLYSCNAMNNHMQYNLKRWGLVPTMTLYLVWLEIKECKKRLIVEFSFHKYVTTTITILCVKKIMFEIENCFHSCTCVQSHWW